MNSQAASCFSGVLRGMLTLAPYRSMAGAAVAAAWGIGAMVQSNGPVLVRLHRLVVEGEARGGAQW